MSELQKVRVLKPGKRERGFVLPWMAMLAVAMFGVMGLAVDLGRLFIAKNETQIFVDSAALEASMALDGTTDGIAAAQARVANSSNTWNFNSMTISGALVDFSTSQDGPWETDPNPAAGYAFARVRVTVPDSLFFMPVVVGVFNQNVTSQAIAGQISIDEYPGIGLSPYTAIGTSEDEPYFGLEPGKEYSLQWPQFNSTRHGCDEDVNACFNGNMCADDSDEAKQAVVDYWPTSYSGYWGFNSASDIRASTLDLIQPHEVYVGMNLEPIMSTGQMQVQARALDTRVSQDGYQASNLPSDYLQSEYRTGRRLLAVPIVIPQSESETTVVGYGQFLLYSDGTDPSTWYRTHTNGNDAFCAVYVGTYTLGSTGPGGSSTGYGGYRVRLTN